MIRVSKKYSTFATVINLDLKKMMKKLMLCMMTLLAMVACGSDDPEDAPAGAVDEKVVGTWTLTEEDIDETDVDVVTLNANGTFVELATTVLKDPQEIAEEGYTKFESRVEGNFTTANGVLTVKPAKAAYRADEKKWTEVPVGELVENTVMKYSVSGNKLTLVDEDGDVSVYTKK